MITPGQYTKTEIKSQPEAWNSALITLDKSWHKLSDFLHTKSIQQVIFTGCGSTYYLSLSGASLLSTITGTPSRGIPASELWLYPQIYTANSRNILLIAVSRSGETTETVQACHNFLDAELGDLLVITNHENTSLEKLGGYTIVLPSGQEKSIAQTRAFSTLYLATLSICLAWNDNYTDFKRLQVLPDLAKKLLTQYASLAKELAQDSDLDRFYFLGSGLRYGLACELSLKMKEMSLSHSEAFYVHEFRHGPTSMAASGALVLGLLGEKMRSLEEKVLFEAKAQGAQILTLGNNSTDINFDTNLHETLYNVLYLPFGQLFAYERSIYKNLNPDTPKNLTAFVNLDLPD